MKGRLVLAGLAGLLLAAAHVPDGALGIGAALLGLALVGAGLALTLRKPERQAGPLLAAAGLLTLTLWPSEVGGRGPLWSWTLGLACAAGLLACAPAGSVPRDRVSAGAWLRRHGVPVAAILLVLAAFVLAPLAVQRLDDPAYGSGYEWRGPYGPLLAGLPLLAAAGALLLAFRAVRGARGEAQPGAGGADGTGGTGAAEVSSFGSEPVATLAEAEP